MDEIEKVGFDLVAKAIVEWTGWGVTARPARDGSRLTDRFGEALSTELVPIVQRLEEDFYSSNAYNTVADLDEMGEVAALEFRSRNPRLPEAAAIALAWCYKFDWK